MKKLILIIMAASSMISCTVTSGKQEAIHGDTLKQISIPFAGQTSKEAEIILEKDTVLPNEDKIRLTVRNSSSHTIRTGNEHYLDRWNGKEWERAFDIDFCTFNREDIDKKLSNLAEE